MLEAGPNRAEPQCPIVDRCGGCPTQQLKYSAQLAGKQALTVDALARIGGIANAAELVEPIVRSPLEFAYRRRARMHRVPGADPSGKGSAWGFAGQESVTGKLQIIPVDRCLLFEPKLQGAGRFGARRDRGSRWNSRASDLGFLVDSEGRGAIDLTTQAAPAARVRHRVEQLVRKVRGLRGATVGPPGNPILVGEPLLADAKATLDFGLWTLGEDAIGSEMHVSTGNVQKSLADPGSFRLRARPDLFAQANRSMLPLLQSAVLEYLGASAQGRILELFCGAGTLTLPLLAAGARAVIGVEEAGPSLLFLRKSADEAGFNSQPEGQGEPRLKLIAGDAAQITASLRATELGRLDAILLDPPRTGAPAAVRAAAALQAKKIVYVSCDAPTLARDSRELAKSGYRLLRARPLDLFPQTAHFEVVALFERNA